MKIRILLLLIFSVFTGSVVAQKNDTLVQKLQQYNQRKAAQGEETLSLKDTVKVLLLHDIVLRDYIAKPQQTLKYIEEQKQLSEKIGYTWGIANAYEMRGNIYENQRKYSAANKDFENAYKLYEQLNDFRAIDVLNNIGVAYSKQGIYTEGLKYHHRALRLSDRFNDIFGYVSSYNNVGIIYTSMKDYDTALKYYFKCLNLQLTKSEGLVISQTYQNIGEIYKIKKDYAAALRYLGEGTKSALKENDTLSLASNYSTASAVYIAMKQYDKALAANEKAYALRQKINDEVGLFTSYNYFGTIYSNTGDNTKALLYSGKALQHLDGHGEIDLYSEAYRQLADINAKIGDYKAAYHNHELYKKYSDSIFNTENQKKLVEQQLNFDFSKKELLAAEALKKERYLRNFTAAGISIATAFFIFFLVKRYRKRARHKKAEYEKGLNLLQDELDDKEIETKSLKLENDNIQLKSKLIASENELLQEKVESNKRELASVMLYASQKNELLAGLRTEIDSVKDGVIGREQIERIKAVIQQNLYLDADWDKFKLHFEQVHPDFFTQLKAEHPGLTAYEIRLYTYLHMKLSTKEIAGLLNITPASVIKAKVRLNKKLNRNDDDALPDA